MVLFHAQLPHRETRRPQGPQQLVAVVLKGLQPGPRGRAHREPAALQAQGAAVGGELGAGQAGPALPEGRQMALALPFLLNGLQALLQCRSRGPRWRH